MAGHFIKWLILDANQHIFFLNLEIVEVLCFVQSHWKPKHGFQSKGDVYRVLLKLAKDCEDIS